MKKTLLAAAVASLFTHSYVSASDETMVVTANRFEQSNEEVIVPVEVIFKEDIQASQAKSLSEVLRKLPGVQITSNGGYGQNSSIYVRGNSNVLFLIDGVRIGSATTGTLNLGQLSLTGIERIEYIRGARAAVYGSDASAGVINLITKTNMSDYEADVSVGVGSNQYSQLKGGMAGSISEDSWASVAVNYQKVDGFNVSKYDSGAWEVEQLDDDAFKSSDVVVNLGSHLSENITATLGAYYHVGKTEYDYTLDWKTTKPGTNESDYIIYNIAGTLTFQKDAFNSSLTAAVNRDDSDNSGGETPGSNIVTDRTVLNWVNTFQLTQQSFLVTGVEFTGEKVSESKLWDSGSQSYLNYDNEARNNTAGYLSIWRNTADIQLEGSLRYDDNEHYGSYSTWQLGAGWSFVEEARIIANIGTSFKAPTFNDLYWPAFGNSALEPEESKTYELGVEGKVSIFDWRISTYKQKIENQIKNQGKGEQLENKDVEIDGVEFSTTFTTGNFEHNVSLDLLDHEDESTGKDLVRVADTSAKWNTSYYSENYQVNLSYLYQGSRSDFPYIPSDLKNRDVRLDSYHLVDLSINYFVTESFVLNGRVDNLLDENYELAYGYNTPERAYYLEVSYQL